MSRKTCFSAPRMASAGLLTLAALATIGQTPVMGQSTPPVKLPELRRSAQTNAPAAAMDAASQRKEQRRQADLVETVFDKIRDFVPDHRAFLADNDQAQIDAMQTLERFREDMSAAITADLVTMANDRSNSYAVRTAAAADRHADYTARTVSSIDLDKFRNSDGRDDLAIAQYFLMAYRAEQMNQLARLYPDSSNISAASGIVMAAMSDLGSLQSVKQGREAAQAARVATMRLYPAVRRDPTTENDFANAWKSSVWTQGEFAGSEVLKVHLLSSGWTVRRNPITGIILSRDQRADLAVRRGDGKCFSYVIELEQKHQGGGTYGRTVMASGLDREMLCENVAS
ncbi:hypothetical protein [Altererythrobacter sp. GH1-8]|uniref:hypothetical protein n=1 Tax=Altererythrobacter sp. GH1-8 TaxID=3349333 RepID=UPI00374DB09B